MAIKNADCNAFQPHTGLTKREYFAIQLMAAFKTQVDPATGSDAYTKEGAARSAVACADALLAELSK